MSFDPIQKRALGRWRHILREMGMSDSFLTGKHGPCPMCGGKDRWRFDDKEGRGTFFCTNCGAGGGVDLVMKFKGVQFIDAKRMIEEVLPGARVEAPRPSYRADAGWAVNLWRAGQPLDGSDPASWYLRKRGLVFERGSTQLRFLPKLSHTDDDGNKTEHPAMGALFVSPGRDAYTVHFTYLDAGGNKADLAKPRKMAPGKIPVGGAVRLAPSADTMGIAEGIETALSAAQIDDIPVWAALSATGLLKWTPPPTAKHIIVYGDNDANYTGQSAAYGLAHRLVLQGFHVDVRIPDLEGDWNDFLVMMSEAAEAKRAPAHAVAGGSLVHVPEIS